jgi:transcriptional regulator with XRE-family HTH domain
MDYRTILKKQLEQRKLINPRFSMRSLAMKIELSASKLSEVIQGKKSLSTKRAEMIADKLGLRDLEREIFVMSTAIGADATSESKAKLKSLITEFNGQKTTQKNAWYFGAVKSIQEEGLEAEKFADELGLTELQIENAQRFLKRIKHLHPERERISFEPTSLLIKLQDDILSQEKDHGLEFMFLSDADAAEMEREVQSTLRKFRLKSSKRAEKKLRMVYFTQFKLSGKR